MPESPGAWSSFLARLADDRALLGELAKAAKARAERYTVANQVRAYSAIYERLLRSKAR